MMFNKAKIKKDLQRHQTTITISGILGCLATVCGLCLAAIAIIPGFWELFFPNNITKTIQQVASHPIKIEYFHEYHSSGFSPILPDPPAVNLDFNKLAYISLPHYNRVAYSIVNTSDKTVILSNELPVRLIDYQPYQNTANILVGAGIGGGHTFRNFVVDLPSTSSVSVTQALFDELPGSGQTIEDIRDEELIDFFALAPGEVEVFSIEVRFDGPGIYTFQPGIEYVENGKKIQVWAPESITAFLPENLTMWESPKLPSEEYVLVGNCTYAFPRDASNVFNEVYECDQSLPNGYATSPDLPHIFLPIVLYER